MLFKYTNVLFFIHLKSQVRVMGVFERNCYFHFNFYESCSPSETLAVMFVCTQTFSAFVKGFTNSAAHFPFSEVRNVQYHLSRNSYRKFHSNGKHSSYTNYNVPFHLSQAINTFKYLLLTEFEVRIVSYGPSFFPVVLPVARALN